MFSWVERTAGSKQKAILALSQFCQMADSNDVNRYSSFVNWELWWPNFPILVYFKEKQTKPEGQIHFFPVIFVSVFKLRMSIFCFTCEVQSD